MPDDPTVQAVMYGPLVLAGRLGTDGLTPENVRAEPTKPRMVPEYKEEPRPLAEVRAAGEDVGAWIHPSPGEPLTFRVMSQDAGVVLVPFYRLFGERYAVYWKVARA
jgi:hypothetical protein